MTKELLDYFNGDDLAASVWEGKYALKNKKKEVVEATPTEMHHRIAKELYRAEQKHFKNNGFDIKSLSEMGQSLPAVLNEEFIFSYLDRFGLIVPQGSIMSQLGNPYSVGSLSNCFVVPPPHDSYSGILYTDQHLVQLMKRRGGVGSNIDTLRPEDTPVNNAAGSSTGAHSFMDRYSNTTREVAQNGRRGALMLLMSCRHPDIFKFVTKKKDRTKVTGANISVMLTNEFLSAAEEGRDFICSFPVDLPFTLDPKDFESYDYNKIYKMNSIETEFMAMRINARELFDLIVEMAWENAEPGVAFMDRVHQYSPEGVYKALKAIASNPCGEQWMQAHDACRLLAINLYGIVGKPFTKDAYIDYNKLYEVAYIQQRLADDIVDLEIEYVDRIIAKIKSDPEPDTIKAIELELWENIKKTAATSRRTGCGFTALGDMLAAVGLKYDSAEGIATIEKVMRTKMEAELDCTIDLAITRGAFEGWDWGLEFSVICGTKTPFKKEPTGFYSAGAIEGYRLVGKNAFYEMLVKEYPEQCERMLNYGRRNVNWSTVAPTGTVSLMTQTSSGLEPVFMLWYMRRKKVNPSDPGARVDFVDQNGDSWTEYAVVHPKFKEWIEINNLLDDKVENAPKEMLQHLFENSPWFGSTANDIDWIKRVEIQGIIQKFTTNAISSTINLPNDVSKEKVSEIYMAAWKAGLKGVTIYRDGCRTGVLVSESEKKAVFESHNAPKRPDSLPCDVYHVTAKGVKWTVVVGLMENKPYEVFAINKEATDISERIKAGTLTKEGKGFYTLSNEKYTIKDVNANMEADEEALTRMISTALRHGAAIDFIVDQLNKSHGSVVSFAKAISRTLAKYSKPIISKEKCTDCGSTNTRKEEGCSKCLDCGSSKCG